MIYLLIINIIGLAAFAIDKIRAMERRFRIPESVLFILAIIGGSLGSVAVNNAVRSALPQLLDKFDIVHLCGKGNTDESLTGTPGYVQYEYIGKELPDLYALSDLVISRAGANVICELLALHKPMLLIPCLQRPAAAISC